MLKEFLADLHVHTLLSPCGEVEMTPHHIMMKAKELGIDIIAITDHNSSLNLPAALESASRYGIKVFPGMEVESKEEGHILVLFDTLKQVNIWQKIVDNNMNGLKNNAQKLGAQFVVDADDEFIFEETRMLSGSLKLSAKEIVTIVNKLGGICIAAHIDRSSFSLVGQLGFLPLDLEFIAAEISPNGLNKLEDEYLKIQVGNLEFITNSDAHWMKAFIEGPKTKYVMEKASISELKLAIKGEKGRSMTPAFFLKK